MSFMNPIAFWGLLGLLVPLFVWLLSKRKQDIVEFGSLTFLQVSESQSARAIYPTQWLQFVLRSLLLLALVFYLAKPVFSTIGKKHIIYVEEAVFQDPTFEELKKALEAESAMVRFSYEEGNEEVEFMPSAQVLIGRINQLRDSLTVYTYNYSKHFIGSHRPLRAGVAWKVWPQKTPLEKSFQLKGEEQAYDLKISSDEDGLNWVASAIELSEDIPEQTINIKLICPQNKTSDKEELITVLNALQEELPLNMNTDASEDIDWTIAIDTMASQYNGALINWDTGSSKLSIQKLSKDLFQLNGSLTVDQLIGSNFALELADVLIHKDLKLDDLDRRVAAIPPVVTIAESNVLEARSEGPRYFWFLSILLILLLERWYAFKIGRS